MTSPLPPRYNKRKLQKSERENIIKDLPSLIDLFAVLAPAYASDTSGMSTVDIAELQSKLTQRLAVEDNDNYAAWLHEQGRPK